MDSERNCKMIADNVRFRAGQDLQQAVYMLIVSANGPEDKKPQRDKAAVSNMRTAAHELGFDLVPRATEKPEASAHPRLAYDAAS